MKGIILAGGNGTRLHPLTITTSKQLLPVYDKPMFYYPLSTLMLAGIKDIMIISQTKNLSQYCDHFGFGSSLGINIEYAPQEEAKGIPDAYLICEHWLRGQPSLLVLGDNIFHGTHFQSVLAEAKKRMAVIGHGTAFCSFVAHPERFGVPKFLDHTTKMIECIVEKPEQPPSSYAVTGLYMLPENAPEYAKKLQPSKRGELEIADLLNIYCTPENHRLYFEDLGRGFAWLDTGTVDALYMASAYIQSLQWQQGTDIGDPYEVAWRHGWISESDYLAARNRRHNARRVSPFPA